MPLSSHSEFRVWNQSMDLACAVYEATRVFPVDERFGIVSQMRTASVSIPANIAEGYHRNTRGEYRNALSVARGSSGELDTLCELSLRLRFGAADQLTDMQRSCKEIQRMLARMNSRLAGRL